MYQYKIIYKIIYKIFKWIKITICQYLSIWLLYYTCQYFVNDFVNDFVLVLVLILVDCTYVVGKYLWMKIIQSYSDQIRILLYENESEIVSATQKNGRKNNNKKMG